MCQSQTVILQVSKERDSSNEANVALKAELERYRDVTGNTVEALEREKAIKAQLEKHNKAQVQTLCPVRMLVTCTMQASKHANCWLHCKRPNQDRTMSQKQHSISKVRTSDSI